MLKGPYEFPHFYLGLSTDTKPSASLGDEFFETDTKYFYIYDGNSWIKKTSLLESFVIESSIYNSLGYKYKAIIYGTGAAPTPTGYPDGCIYIQYVA